LRQHGDPRKDYASEWLEWRREHGWSQPQMALALGVSSRTVFNVEKGLRKPCIKSREKMAQLKKRYREAECQS
jgi:DNA-binding XRE family transcriptional regulator